jgi:elongation factor Ts
MELAIDNLRKSSALKAAKKADRTAADGLLGVKVADDGKSAALVEINIETDFAAKNEKFIAFVGRVTDAIFEQRSGDIAAIAGIDAERETLVQEIGENISLRRAEFVDAGDGSITSYLHTNQRQAALVVMTGGDEALGKDIAMHVTAINPMVIEQSEVPEASVAKEREIAAAQAAESGKPPEIVEKMVEGKVRKFLAEVSLMDQPFVKDGNIKVNKLLKDAGAKVTQFIRYEVGEGIEVEEVDFATEVAQQLGND